MLPKARVDYGLHFQLNHRIFNDNVGYRTKGREWHCLWQVSKIEREIKDIHICPQNKYLIW